MQPLWKIIPVHSAESSRWTLCWPISIGCCQLHWYESFMHLKFFHGRINWIKLKTQALVHLVLCVTCWVKTRHFPANIEFKLEAILSTQVVFQPNSVFAPCYRRLALYHTELWNLALLLNYKDDISSNSHGTCFQKNTISQRWMTRIIQNCSCSIWRQMMIQCTCISWKNYPNTDDYRWSAIIQFWNWTIPGIMPWHGFMLPQLALWNVHIRSSCLVQPRSWTHSGITAPQVEGKWWLKCRW